MSESEIAKSEYEGENGQINVFEELQSIYTGLPKLSSRICKEEFDLVRLANLLKTEKEVLRRKENDLIFSDLDKPKDQKTIRGTNDRAREAEFESFFDRSYEAIADYEKALSIKKVEVDSLKREYNELIIKVGILRGLGERAASKGFRFAADDYF